jgi:hypothetical protein
MGPSQLLIARASQRDGSRPIVKLTALKASDAPALLVQGLGRDTTLVKLPSPGSVPCR